MNECARVRMSLHFFSSSVFPPPQSLFLLQHRHDCVVNSVFHVLPYFPLLGDAPERYPRDVSLNYFSSNHKCSTAPMIHH